MNKTIAILQSSYIPWLGYFDMINQVDEFILYDDTQFTKRDWRNRNWIKTAEGGQWLTIPVETKGKFHQKISDVKISDKTWWKTHWKTIHHHYGNSPYFKEYKTSMEKLYEDCSEIENLSVVNHHFISALCDALSIKTKISSTVDYEQKDLYKTERLVDLCQQAGANNYLSGPKAQHYLDETLFLAANITVNYINYSCYKPYPQLYGDFTQHVSIIDLLFNTGPEAQHYIKQKS